MVAAPAYHTVAARQTLPRAPVPVTSDPQPPPKIQFSPEVRDYTSRAFATENEIPGISNTSMQVKLKEILNQLVPHQYNIDWTNYPLPQVIMKREQDQAALHGAQNGLLANTNGSGASAWPHGSSSPTGGKKRKSPDTEVSEPEQEDTTPPGKKHTGKIGLGDRITGRTKAQEKKQKKNEVMRVSNLDLNAEILEKRKQRFGQNAPASPYISSRDESPAPSGPVIGTCEDLEKDYFRLTAPPAAETVRPLAILEQTLDMIRKKWKKDHNYSYACNQLKSLRQDLTVQHIKNEFTVKVYELHARIALEMADLGEYNQCQTQLRALYKSRLGGNPEEFTAYRILYFIYTRNRTGMNDVLADLTTADKQKPGVRHALQVRSTLASGNYHKFFRLYDDAPFMGPYLLDMFVQRERLAAMAAMCRSYKPDVSIHFLASELAFHGEEDDADAAARQCLDFLCQAGAEHLVERKEGDVRFLTGKAGQHFENARAAAFRSVDIKGQI